MVNEEGKVENTYVDTPPEGRNALTDDRVLVDCEDFTVAEDFDV